MIGAAFAVSQCVIKARARLPLLGLFGAIACSGSAFSSDGVGGKGAGGQLSGGSSGASSEAGDGGETGAEGGAALGGQGAGAEAGSAAGGASGAGGGGTEPSCAELEGLTYGEHCYVEVRAQALNQVEAAAACAELESRSGLAAHLLVLDTVEEQSFIIESFLSETADAWLGLTCSSAEHPELTDCYCQQCEDGQLLDKRAAWSWPDGSSASFGWSGNNPDGALRCSALAFNPSVESWGWVDRSCLSTSHRIDDFPEHSYLAICELP